ncbi:uncharacterized protein LOC120457869 [Drosophila santomea]|uniref:uncharacterized protein LOC120457869 n=1 Tax=Drosophila santomea TaxID=129105 RepID=UPI001953FDC2|nr:uncharacterized protein LOC120457869 [Drosophila santomea]
MCIDYRLLNDETEKDAENELYPGPAKGGKVHKHDRHEVRILADSHVQGQSAVHSLHGIGRGLFQLQHRLHFRENWTQSSDPKWNRSLSHTWTISSLSGGIRRSTWKNWRKSSRDCNGPTCGSTRINVTSSKRNSNTLGT